MPMTIETPTVETSPKFFVDRHGQSHRITPGHRDRLKPGWRRMLCDNPPPPDDNDIRGELEGLASRLDLAVSMLRTGGFELTGRRVLSAGCGDISEPMYLAAWGAAEVVGADHRLAETREQTADLRRLATGHLAELGRIDALERATVELLDDDLAASRLRDASFDAVCSWRTLEHVIDPEAAMREMHRVLRPGGFAYHEYNPFFGLDGGHSLVTLDMSWGHVRLDAEDVARYIRTHRPAEIPRAVDYYHDCLNRMTIGQMSRMARAAGFEVVALVPRSRTEDLLAMTPDVFAAARRNYPAVTLNDLVCRIVRVVLRRPETR